MIYISETELPSNMSIFSALTQIYGLGTKQALTIIKMLGFSSNLKVNSLSEKQQLNLTQFCNSMVLSKDLKMQNLQIKKKLISIKSFKGLRRRIGLPIRGQRTHTNARTSKRIK